MLQYNVCLIPPPSNKKVVKIKFIWIHKHLLQAIWDKQINQLKYKRLVDTPLTSKRVLSYDIKKMSHHLPSFNQTKNKQKMCHNFIACEFVCLCVCFVCVCDSHSRNLAVYWHCTNGGLIFYPFISFYKLNLLYKFYSCVTLRIFVLRR